MIFGSRRKPPRTSKASRLAIAAVLCGAALGVQAAAAGDWNVERLMRELAQRKPGKAKFVEQRYLKILKSPLESSGSLQYVPPNRLEKITDYPRSETLTVDGDKVTIENPRNRRVISLHEYPVVRAFVESIRATLKGDFDTLNRYYRLNLEGERAQWKLSLAPIEQEMRETISRIVIGGNNDRVRLVEVQEADGDRSIMTVTEAR
jgi:hypothetical protein